ncbi:MAG: hypothetical protein HYU58_00170 [Proteobacteria bacterium]|nr:hypothetical protein [Pseudomonadota bacterium]
MQFFYVAVDGGCLGSFDGLPAASPFPGTPIAIAPEDSAEQRWDGSAWVWPAEALRHKKMAAIAERYRQALQAGFAYGGKILQIREQDQANLTTMGNEARWAKAAGSAWPADFAWRMADDSFLALPNAEAMIALAESAKMEVYRLQRVKWAHVDALRALTAAADVVAYNFETGW